MQDLSEKSAYELKTPYAFWQDSEGIPTYGGYWIEDVRTVELADWQRTGGRGAFVNLNGAGMKAFANLPFWNKNFIGAGAFRVVEWDGGSRMELEAFNDFALGRPKIDRMTFKTVEDTNTNLAAVLAGEVDFCMRSTISFDGAVILREQWEKQGKGKVLTSPASWTWLNLSRDNAWFSDGRVRRALLHAIDRDAMAHLLVGVSISEERSRRQTWVVVHSDFNVTKCRGTPPVRALVRATTGGRPYK